MTYALTSGRVALPGRIESGVAVLVEGDSISAIVPEAELDSGVERLDVGGRTITAGLIDIHTHGAGGDSFNDADPAAWERICATQARNGVTTLLPTLATAAISDLEACLRTARGYLSESHDGAAVAGVHLEGPWFSHVQRGAHPAAFLRPPNDGSADTLLEFHDVLSVVTFAPELPGALDLTARLVKLGVKASVGHSDATQEQVQACVDEGVEHCVHLWSGQSSVTRNGPWRIPGLLETSLASETLTGEVIADGKHLPGALMKIAMRCMPSRLCAVSDSTPGAGLAEGSRFKVGTVQCEVRDGVARLPDDPNVFAGSTTLLGSMIAILQAEAGASELEAIEMATRIPAQIASLSDRGTIEVGKRADLAVFDSDYRCWKTIIGGTQFVEAANG